MSKRPDDDCDAALRRWSTWSRSGDSTVALSGWYVRWLSLSFPVVIQYRLPYLRHQRYQVRLHEIKLLITAVNNSVCCRVVKSECVAGEQNVHYLAPKYCLMAEDVPSTKKVSCSTQIPFVLQVNKNWYFVVFAFINVIVFAAANYHGMRRDGHHPLSDSFHLLET